MNHSDLNTLARVTIEDSSREANHHRLAREFRRSERASTARTAPQKPQRHSRLWSLVHFRHAYS
jgi:hypothetical protein